MRFDPGGILDATFGAGGRVFTQLEGESAARAGALTDDGRLIVVGGTRVPGAGFRDDKFGLARFDLTCPALPDADGHGLGDACDPCTLPAMPLRLSVKLRRLGSRSTDAKFGLAGTAVVPAAPPLDFLATGVRVVIADALGATLVDALQPPGPRVASTGVGWSGSAIRGKWCNVDVAPPRIAGIGSISARVSGTGSVRVQMKAQGPVWELNTAQLPLHRQRGSRPAPQRGGAGLHRDAAVHGERRGDQSTLPVTSTRCRHAPWSQGRSPSPAIAALVGGRSCGGRRVAERCLSSSVEYAQPSDQSYPVQRSSRARRCSRRTCRRSRHVSPTTTDPRPRAPRSSVSAPHDGPLPPCSASRSLGSGRGRGSAPLR